MTTTTPPGSTGVGPAVPRAVGDLRQHLCDRRRPHRPAQRLQRAPPPSRADLNHIQDYALELAQLAGAAGGPGGRGLRRRRRRRQARGHLRAGRHRWRAPVELPSRDHHLPRQAGARHPVQSLVGRGGRRAVGHGDAAVTGTLCDEPCSGGTSTRLFVAEGVKIQLTADTYLGLHSVSLLRRCAWLASRLFALEQEQAGYHRPKGSAGSGRPSTACPRRHRRWRRAPAGRPAGRAHPSSGDGRFVVDRWTARRVPGRPAAGAVPPMATGMRPWNVVRLPRCSSSRTPWPTSGPDRSSRYTDPARARLRGPAAGGVPAVPAPAGKASELERPGRGRQAYIEGLASGLDVRVCVCRPVDVAQAVREAQHRDRIPLTSAPGVRNRPSTCWCRSGATLTCPCTTGSPSSAETGGIAWLGGGGADRPGRRLPGGRR